MLLLIKMLARVQISLKKGGDRVKKESVTSQLKKPLGINRGASRRHHEGQGDWSLGLTFT